MSPDQFPRYTTHILRPCTCLDAYPTYVLQAWGGVRHMRHMAPQRIPAHPARPRARTRAHAHRRATCLIRQLRTALARGLRRGVLEARAHALLACPISPHSSQRLARSRPDKAWALPRRLAIANPPWTNPLQDQVLCHGVDFGPGSVGYSVTLQIDLPNLGCIYYIYPNLAHVATKVRRIALTHSNRLILDR